MINDGVQKERKMHLKESYYNLTSAFILICELCGYEMTTWNTIDCKCPVCYPFKRDETIAGAKFEQS